MRRWIAFALVTALLVVGGTMVYKLAVVPHHELDEQLSQALQAYRQGEAGATLASRKQGFNQALEIYGRLEKQHSPCMSSGRLFYNLANTYFQLGEYPMAILYYYKSWNLQPRDVQVKHNLETALDKLNLNHPEPISDVQRLLYFHFFLSTPERLQCFGLCAIILLTVLGIRIACPVFKTYLDIMAVVLGVICLVLACSLLYSRYLEPLQGVVMKSTYLYRDKGKEYARLGNTPAAAGTKVDVLDIQNQGEWFKILTPDGTLGYVPEESIRLISCI